MHSAARLAPFTGNAKLAGVNGVIKWAPNGNATYYNGKLGRIFPLEAGRRFIYSDAGQQRFSQVAGSPGHLAIGRSTGCVAVHPQWRVGYRYDRLNYNAQQRHRHQRTRDQPTDFPVLPILIRPATAMVDWADRDQRIGCNTSDKSQPGSPTTSCSCNTSTAWARMARTRF